MTCCSLRCDSCRDLQKTRRVEEYTITACQSRPFPFISEENKKPDMTIKWERLGEELGDKVFLMWILLKKSSTDIQTAATTSQRLFKAFWKSTAVDKKLLLLSSYIQGFKSMFAKEEFDILLEHH